MTKNKTDFPKWLTPNASVFEKKITQEGILRTIPIEDGELSDYFEQSGRNTSLVLSYKVDKEKKLLLHRHIIRHNYNNSSFAFDDDRETCITIEGKIIQEKVCHIDIEDRITFYTADEENKIKIARSLFPATYGTGIIEKIEIQCESEREIALSLSDNHYGGDNKKGKKMLFGIGIADEKGCYFPDFEGEKVRKTAKNGYICYYLAWYAVGINEEYLLDCKLEDKKRKTFFDDCIKSINIETGNDEIDLAFTHSFKRLAETITLYDDNLFLTGGTNRTNGILTKEQLGVEAPFLAYSGYIGGLKPLLNTLGLFAVKAVDSEKKKNQLLPSYIGLLDDDESKNDIGQWAYYCNALASIALTIGSPPLASEMYKTLGIGLDYCRKNSQKGVVALAKKISADTSGVAYDAYLKTSILAGLLGKDTDVSKYAYFARELRDKREIFEKNSSSVAFAYGYFEDKKILQDALNSEAIKMGIPTYQQWNNLVTEEDKNLSIIKTTLNAKADLADENLLYLIKSAFCFGLWEEGYYYLNQYTKIRTLGCHSPYPVNCQGYSDGSIAALYCRIFVEGILGYRPISFSSFSLTPNLPREWSRVKLNNFYTCGHSFDIEVEENEIRVYDETEELIAKLPCHNGFSVTVNLETDKNTK